MKRLHEFDALRGIAAVAVVFSHALNYLPAGVQDPYQHWSAPLWSFMANGHFAVLVFFAISGFVLSYPYAVGAKTGRNLTIDTVNRLPRLFIPVFLTGLLCFALQSAALRWTGGPILAPFASPDWVANWDVSNWDLTRMVEFLTTRVFFFYSETDTFNVNLWTMPVEFAFSLLVFGVCAAYLRRFNAAAFLILAGIVSIATWRAAPIEYFIKSIDGFAFFIGVFCAFFADHIRALGLRVRRLPVISILLGLLLSSVVLRDDVHYLLGEGIGLLAITLLICGFFAAPALRVVLNRPVFAFLGDVSFALYLIHGSVLYLVFQVAAGLGPYGYGMFVVGSVISLVLSFALAHLIARHIEMPLVTRVRRAIGSAVHDRAPA